MTYLRVTIGTWSINLYSLEGEGIFRQIQEEGIKIFRQQPGFINYRLMLAGPSITLAVAEWESEALGRPGAMVYRTWLKESGIAAKLKLETYDGDVVASS
ncbi:MAG: antibiotic biosynthesis monooxygenase [Methanomicrobiales archaeon]|nr:antibiotic biosynthesis monooxygenase [Methanomicrobiales archaeon]